MESDRRSAVARAIRIQENGPERHACSEVFDQIGQHVDDIAVINSMHTNIPSHEFATVMMNTGAAAW